MSTGDGTIKLEIPAETDEERAALQQALLRARASELAELRRHEVRLGAGYGDSTTRASMTEEADRARLRWTMLDRLVSSLPGAPAPEVRGAEAET
jgi:hypothetical protein